MVETKTNINKIKLDDLKTRINCLAERLLPDNGDKPRVRHGAFRIPGITISGLLGEQGNGLSSAELTLTLQESKKETIDIYDNWAVLKIMNICDNRVFLKWRQRKESFTYPGFVSAVLYPHYHSSKNQEIPGNWFFHFNLYDNMPAQSAMHIRNNSSCAYWEKEDCPEDLRILRVAMQSASVLNSNR